MNLLTLYGASIVTLMMVFYALEQKSSWFTLAFGISCIGSADSRADRSADKSYRWRTAPFQAEGWLQSHGDRPIPFR